VNVYVVTPEPDCPAHRALAQEGVEHLELLCEGDYDYGNYLTDLWNNEKTGFVLIEHDIIPWPGAIQAMKDCQAPGCTHRVPIQPGNVGLCGLTAMKIMPIGRAPSEWRRTHWQYLDGMVIPYIHQMKRQFAHVHEPPFAHARKTVVGETMVRV
jgi:hypothetical protein